MDIIALAFDMKSAVEQFVQKAKNFFYGVMLLGYTCPKCNHPLGMIAESRCKCHSCGYEFDPTILFQCCFNCGGLPKLRVRRYICSKCGNEVKSKFVFEGLVFDTRYFCQKMAESRQTKKEQRESVRMMLANSRSDAISLQEADLSAMPDLVEVLNSLTQDEDKGLKLDIKVQFDLNRYQEHILTHLDSDQTDFVDIPHLEEDQRLDRIWRFIAIIFLTHANQVEIIQEGEKILVMKYEAN